MTLGVQYGADAGEQTLAFPVTQVCEVGETAWAEVAEEGEDPHDLDTPAPTVAVAEPDGGTGGHSASKGASAGSPGADDDATAPVSSLPIVLGSGGLVLGATALALALLALRRARGEDGGRRRPHPGIRRVVSPGLRRLIRAGPSDQVGAV